MKDGRFEQPIEYSVRAVDRWIEWCEQKHPALAKMMNDEGGKSVNNMHVLLLASVDREIQQRVDDLGFEAAIAQARRDGAYAALERVRTASATDMRAGQAAWKAYGDALAAEYRRLDAARSAEGGTG